MIKNIDYNMAIDALKRFRDKLYTKHKKLESELVATERTISLLKYDCRVGIINKDILVGNKNPSAVEIGRLGGLKGGKARAEKLSPERRSQISRDAARARWDKAKGQTKENSDGRKD